MPDSSNISPQTDTLLDLRYTKYIPSIWSLINHRIIVSVWMNKENIWTQYQRQEYEYGNALFRDCQIPRTGKGNVHQNVNFQLLSRPLYLGVSPVFSNSSYRRNVSISALIFDFRVASNAKIIPRKSKKNLFNPDISFVDLNF